MQHRYHLVFLFIIAFAIPVMAHAEDTATLLVGGEKPFFHKQPVVIDGAVYASLPAVNTLGAKYSTARGKEDGQRVDIQTADGDQFWVHAKLVDGELLIPIREIASKMDAVAEWDSEARVLKIRSRIQSIAFNGEELRITTSYPVSHKVIWWGSVKKLIVDIDGVDIPAKTSDIPFSNSTSVPIRTGVQADGRTGRVVLDLPCNVRWRTKSPVKTSNIVIGVSGLQDAPGLPTDTGIKQPQTEVLPMDSAQQTPDTSTASVTRVDYHKDGSRRVDVYVAVKGPAKYETSLTHDPNQLILDIKHASLDEEIDDISVSHDILQGIHVGQSGDNVRVTMDLKRIVGFDVARDGSSGRFTISMVLPKGADGTLDGKTVVIDPGHGGGDVGAVALDGSLEKDYNLSVAKRARQLLMDAGVCVILTRSDDRAVDVDKRQDLIKRATCAAKHSADAFLSIHHNALKTNCPSGTETYYHGRDLSGKALAYSLHSEVVKASGMPDLDVRSDFKLYQTGLGVLRNASERYGIPAMLLEIGYLRNRSDLDKIRDPEFQQKVAQAIVDGFKEYFEGNSRPTKQSLVTPVPNRPANEDTPAPKPEPRAVEKPRAVTERVPETKPDKPARTNGPKRPGE